MPRPPKHLSDSILSLAVLGPELGGEPTESEASRQLLHMRLGLKTPHEAEKQSGQGANYWVSVVSIYVLYHILVNGGWCSSAGVYRKTYHILIFARGRGLLHMLDFVNLPTHKGNVQDSKYHGVRSRSGSRQNSSASRDAYCLTLDCLYGIL